MANYANSVLLAAIGKVAPKFQAKEFRRQFYGAHELFLKDVDYSVPNLAEIRASTLRTTTAKYLTKSSPTVGTTRACSPSGTVGDSGTVDLTWTPYVASITVSEKRHGNNYYSKVDALAAELEGVFQALHDDIETDMIANLETNKTGVNNGSAFMGTWDSVNDIYEIAQASKTNYYNYIKTIMRENKYRGELYAVQNVAAMAVMDEQVAQGSGNSTNLQYNYTGLQFLESTALTVTSDYHILSYVAEPSSVGVLDWIEPLNRRGQIAGEKEWTTMQDPFGFGWTWQVFYTRACADTSGSAGATQDLTETWEISIDLALVKAPLSTANETPIYKFGLTAS